MSLKPITIFALGGTIAMARDGNGAGAVPKLSAQTLIKAVPELADAAAITALDFRQLPGAHLGMDDIIALARALEEARANGAAGAVITQGTDTIEETGFVLDLLVDRDFPVVITGAMRHPGQPGADGAANLLAAVITAATADLAGCGTCVVMNDEIHAGAFAQKTHATRPDAFSSPNAGPLGFVNEGTAHILMRPAPRPRLEKPETGAAAPAIALIGSGLGDDGKLAASIQKGGFQGLVIDAMGAGHLTEAAAKACGALAQAMPVVFASRTGAGATLSDTYGFPGSETDLSARGLIRAGLLSAPKARLLLMLCLMNGLDETAIRDIFRGWNGG